MELRPLGRTDLKVSALCLGTMTWGEQNTEEEGHAQMDYATANGINFFDTAELYAVPPRKETYGRTEEIIGTWFKKSGKRDQVILATKVAGPGLPWIRDAQPITPEGITKALENSLKRLQTDFIDLYQLHWPNRPHYHFGRYRVDFSKTNAQEEEAAMLAILQRLDQHIKEGKIRHVGLSDDTAWGTMKYLHLAEKHNLPRMASIQNEYSLLCRIFEPDLHEIALMEDIGLLAWSPLATGVLSGKYLNGQMPEGTRLSLLKGRTNRAGEQVDAAISAYLEIAKKHGLDACQMALSFVTSRPFTTSCIIGATSMEQLKTNIASASLTLSREVLNEIDAVYRRFPNVFWDTDF